MAPPQKLVQTVGQEEYKAVDFGAIPKSVADLFAAKGHNVFLSYASPQNVSAMASRHAFSLAISDIPKEAVDEVRQDLRRYGFTVDSDGTIRKGDCLLLSQPETARQHFEQENYETWKRQGYASDAQAEAIQEEARRTSGGGSSLFVGAKTEGDFAKHFGRGSG